MSFRENILERSNFLMEELTKQVKSEMLRTLLWLVVSLGAAISIYYVIWK